MIIIGILEEIYRLFMEMAPYLMIGLIFVGILHIFFSKDLIIKHIGKNDISSVIKSTLFGIPLPLCSCGVIPSSVYMARNGASKPSVISFLISTPQTGIDSIIATYGMMGWVFAIFRPIAALFMGIISGIVTIFISKNDNNELKSIELKTNTENEIDHYSVKNSNNLRQKFNKMTRYAFVEFLDDISIQFLIGLIIAGLISYFIPDDFFRDSTINSGFMGMILMILISAPMYVCATASIPIAVSLMMKGFTPGVAFVFMAVGPATNAASFTIILKVLGKKLALAYIFSIIISAIIFGYILDYIFYYFQIDQNLILSHIHHHTEDSNNILFLSFSIIFSILLVASYYRKIRDKFIIKKEFEVKNNDTIIKIDGMTCNHCVMNVEKAIKSTSGVRSVEISLNDKVAKIAGDFNIEEVKKNIESMGYKVIN